MHVYRPFKSWRSQPCLSVLPLHTSSADSTNAQAFIWSNCTIESAPAFVFSENTNSEQGALAETPSPFILICIFHEKHNVNESYTNPPECQRELT